MPTGGATGAITLATGRDLSTRLGVLAVAVPWPEYQLYGHLRAMPSATPFVPPLASAPELPALWLVAAGAPTLPGAAALAPPPVAAAPGPGALAAPAVPLPLPAAL